MQWPQPVKILIILACFPLLCQAKTEDDAAVRMAMSGLAHDMQDIFPLIFKQDEEIIKEKDVLAKKVKALDKSFREAKLHVEQRTIAFKTSYNVMLQNLKETEKLFAEQKPVKATHRLKILPSLCVSCHVQDAKQQKFFMGLDRNHFDSDFQFAEFSFATRDYGSAITYYDRYLTSPGSFKSEARMRTALQRLMTLYVQVNHEPKLAATYLNEYVPFIVDYPGLKQELIDWITDLKSVSPYYQEILSGSRQLDFPSLEALAKALEDPQAAKEHPIHFVILRGLIYDYLNQQPKDNEVPKLLYWLALADKKLDYQYYYSFADVYLKECFTQYPDDPYAKQCRKEYESYKTMG